jgi:hypothetical protein
MHGAAWLAPLDTLPAAALTLPLEIVLGEPGLVEQGEVLREWEADVLPAEPIEIAGGVISSIPAGDWTRLAVAVSFDGGGHAFYVWRIGS